MIEGSGSIIFLNGTSSSGKSTIARELQKSLSEAYMIVSLDAFLHQLPDAYLSDRKYLSQALPNLLGGFDASNAAIARAGNNVIVDHVLQEPSWVVPCAKAFEGLDVVFVGVRCSLNVLEDREKIRGDRQVGTARYQYDRVHFYNTYDIEVDTSKMSVNECVSVISDYVHSNKQPMAFKKLRVMPDGCERDVVADADKPCH